MAEIKETGKAFELEHTAASGLKFAFTLTADSAEAAKEKLTVGLKEVLEAFETKK